jgi:mannose-6-phosphate isomerase-like protein (cupin superfamily)
MIRCVVTGEREGKAVVVSDATLEFAPLALVPEQTEFFRLWGEDRTPVLPSDGSPPEQPTYFPRPGGFRFLVITLAPDATKAGPVDDFDAAIAEFNKAMPGYGEFAESDDSGMHRADTIDLDVVISGEMWLELDDGAEVLLRAGDCVIQNGTRHAWHNRSSEPCRFVAAVIGATRVMAS